MRRLIAAAIVLVVFVLFAFGPGIVHKPTPLVLVEADRTQPSSRVIVRRFRLEQYTRDFTLSARYALERPGCQVQFLDGSGKTLVDFGFQEDYKNSFPFCIGQGLKPGLYQVRVVEDGLLGRYSVSLYQGRLPGTSSSQLLIATLALALSVGYYGYSLLRGGSGSPVAANARYILGCVLFGFTMTIAYPLIHETGHAVVFAHYGRFDLHGTDFIGLWGTPHAGRTPGPGLGSWGEAVMSIAGPMLPNLVGYLMFGAWLVFRRWFSRSSARDVFWSGMTACMLFAQIFAFVPILGLVQDGDYSGYISNIPIPHWQANGLLLVSSVANTAIVLTIIKHLVRTYQRKDAVRH